MAKVILTEAQKNACKLGKRNAWEGVGDEGLRKEENRLYMEACDFHNEVLDLQRKLNNAKEMRAVSRAELEAIKELRRGVC